MKIQLQIHCGSRILVGHANKNEIDLFFLDLSTYPYNGDHGSLAFFFSVLITLFRHFKVLGNTVHRKLWLYDQVSSGSSGRVKGEGERETSNLCDPLRRPSFYDLFLRGRGGWPPRLPLDPLLHVHIIIQFFGNIDLVFGWSLPPFRKPKSSLKNIILSWPNLNYIN